MPKAIWNNKILAHSDHTEIVEGNHYFPTDSVNREYFKDSETRSTCPWKGEASYYNIKVDGKINTDAAWYYPNPKSEATHIKNYVAFWNGVEVTD